MDVFVAAAGAFAPPVLDIYKMVRISGPPPILPDVKGHFSGGTLMPYHHKIATYVAVQCGSLWKVVLAALCWFYTVDMAAASLGYDFSHKGWVAAIVYRDLVLMVVVCGGWDWLLYWSPLKERMAPYKYHAMQPPRSQWLRDVAATTSATLLASVQEVLLMRWWAGGFFKRALFGAPSVDEAAVPWGISNTFFGTKETAVFSTPEMPAVGAIYFSVSTLYFLAWIATMFYWRIAHFYFIHRLIHPWWDRMNGLAQGDIGAVFFRYVHSHHHKSFNPTPWSGVSMLPIESTAYMSAALIPLLFRCGCHPFIHLYTKLDLIIGAQIGHSGFDAPGGGDYFHQLHHAHFECNYGGGGGIPFDWIFGTFEDGSSYSSDEDLKNTGQTASITTSVNDEKETPLLVGERPAFADNKFTLDEVRRHSTREDCWLIIQGIVLNVTRFLAIHPGGDRVMLPYAGGDATAVFESIHNAKGGFALIQQWAPKAPIGIVQDWVAKRETGQSSGQQIVVWWISAAALNIFWFALCGFSWRVLLMGD